MRTEKEMYNLILKVAREDERIRAVFMNGSRTNPNVLKDRFQDFDIVYVVNETKDFINNKEWLEVYGELTIMQEPDSFQLYKDDLIDIDKKYTYLMQFADGNRIDLTVLSIKYLKEFYLQDKLTLPLLDKDGILPKIDPPTDIDYHVKKPSKELFQATCNEIWWVSPYVAKGLCRNELLYAIDHINFFVRPMLLRMLSWHAGILTNFSISVGKNYKYIDKYLPHHLIEKLTKCYPLLTKESMWEALFNMIELYRETAKFVSSNLGYEYNLEEDQKTFKYISELKEIDIN